VKIVILGNGLLGTELVKQSRWDIISRKEDGFDITNPSTFDLLLECAEDLHLGKAVCKARYDTVINCIAFTDTYSENKSKHWDVNYKGVADLVKFCNTWNIKLVHISTDYVYANSIGIPSEEDVPVHQATHYAHTKLLADGYVELKANNYLIIRATHKPYSFPYKGAWINQLGNFDYVNVIAAGIIKSVEKQVEGVLNVGTEFKSMFNLAQRTNPTVAPIRIEDIRIPVNTHMDVSKFNSL
jgi:dTDP-4-dehydrorhamnose reductase